MATHTVSILIFSRYVIAVLMSVALSCSATLASEANKKGSANSITLVYENKGNPPYYFDETKQSSRRPGVSIELFDLVAERLGLTFEYVRRPWARGLEGLKANKFDGIFNASYKPERELYGLYPMKDGRIDNNRSTIRQAYYFYKKVDSHIVWDGKRLRGLKGKIGTIIEYSINADLKAMSLEVDPAPQQETNLKKLAAGRIELIADIDTMNDGFMLPGKKYHGKFIKLDPPIKQKPYFLVFSHQFAEKHPELIESIWDEIVEVRNSLEFKDILNSYY